MRTEYHNGPRGGNGALDITRRGVLQIGRGRPETGALRPNRTVQNYTLWALRGLPSRGFHHHPNPYQAGPHRDSRRGTRRRCEPCSATGVPERDASAASAWRSLVRVRWSMRCRLHRIDELTALLGSNFRALSKLEDEERCLLALLEAATPAELLRCGPWSDASGRATAPPSWWPTLPDGWRLTAEGELEDPRGRRRLFASDDELVAFVRDLKAPKLPAPKLQRVRPRARSRQRSAGNGGRRA